ncbi:MAG: hypothetical protein NVS2B11_03460 [Acetobacteraceae bacterium]
MQKINTTSAFTVSMPDGRSVPVQAGESEVEDDVATHPFVAAHLVEAVKGRMPLVNGPDGLLIQADEAGQRVTSVVQPLTASPSLRQEGPLEWSREQPESKPAEPERDYPVDETSATIRSSRTPRR